MKNNDIGYTLKNISEALDKMVNENLRAAGITSSQIRVLAYLVKNRNRIVTQKQLERHFKVSHPTIVGIVGRLEAKGYVKCYADNSDKRQKIVELADLDEEKQKMAKAYRQRAEQKLFAGFSSAERDELFRLLDKVYQNILK